MKKSTGGHSNQYKKKRLEKLKRKRQQRRRAARREFAEIMKEPEEKDETSGHEVPEVSANG
jgi:hypothetical protein